MRVRPTARLIVLDDHDRVLLFRYEDKVVLDPRQPNLRVYWATPGGGLEADETFEQAASRELWEETGIRSEVGAWVWSRERKLHFPDGPVLFHERYFVVRVSDSEVSWDNLQEYERDVCQEHRWWSLEEMRDSSEIFLPPALADLLTPVVAGNFPAQPLLIETAP